MPVAAFLAVQRVPGLARRAAGRGAVRAGTCHSHRASPPTKGGYSDAGLGALEGAGCGAAGGLCAHPNSSLRAAGDSCFFPPSVGEKAPGLAADCWVTGCICLSLPLPFQGHTLQPLSLPPDTSLVSKENGFQAQMSDACGAQLHACSVPVGQGWWPPIMPCHSGVWSRRL